MVEGWRVARHLGAGYGVYSTPAMVHDMETLCGALLMEHLNDGEHSVGTRVDILHLAATPEGMWVNFTARVKAVDHRAVTFEIVARDAIDEVGHCTHERFVVDLAKIKEKLAAKIEKGREASRN